MEPIHVIVMDEDEEYIRMLAAFVRSQDLGARISLACFSRKDCFEQHLDRTERGHALFLIHESLSAEYDVSRIPGKLIWLSETSHRFGETSYNDGGDVPRIFKFQPLNQFFAQLASFYPAAEAWAKEETGKRTARTIAVYSAAGGAGKTTVALNLAYQFAVRQQNVFLLNLELFSSMPSLMPDGDRDRFAELLYYARTQPRELPDKIERLKNYDHATKLNYFAATRNLQETLEMTEADVRNILSSLAHSGAYDVIVIDLESTLHDRVWGAFAGSDNIFWILADDLHCHGKSLAAWNELRRKEQRLQERVTNKITFLLNKFTGRLHNRMDHTLSPIGYLPYIPEWKTVSSGEHWLASPLFNAGLWMAAATALNSGRRRESDGIFDHPGNQGRSAGQT